ncbi:MAG: FapA family protein, partial [Spirochaetota bacterium]
MNITEFRNLITEQWEMDRKVTRHQMSGPNLDSLVRQASQQLNIPLEQLDYEIEERANHGLMRMISPKDFKILVYRSEVDYSGDQPQFTADMVAQQELFAPIPGKMFVQVWPDGVYLKLSPPKNGGKPVNEQDVLLHINRLLGRQAKSRLISELCRNELCDYTKVAEIDHRPSSDAHVNVQISQDRMQATIIVTEPEDYGAHLQYSHLVEVLHDNGVTYGYEEESLKEFCDEPVYNQAVSIAHGTEPVDGHDLYIETIYDKQDTEDAEETGGKVSLRKGNIKTVSEGSLIGILHNPSQGEVGHDVFGTVLDAVPGNDRPYNIDVGCRFDEHTKEIFATTSGEVIFDEETQHIKVLEIYIVEGNLQNDVDFPGSILIKGDVDNGYNIRAESNITIMGHLGKSRVESGGYLIIKAGINAVDAAQDRLVHAKGNIYARYINNAGVSSDQNIIVDDGILGSTVFADEYVVCRGKRAIINASVVNARFGIYAKAFGSASGTATELVVAMPRKLSEERNSLQEKYAEYLAKIKPLKQGLNVQNRQKE